MRTAWFGPHWTRPRKLIPCGCLPNTSAHVEASTWFLECMECPISIIRHPRSPRALCLLSQLHLQPFLTSPSTPKLYSDKSEDELHLKYIICPWVSVSKPIRATVCCSKRAFLGEQENATNTVLGHSTVRQAAIGHLPFIREGLLCRETIATLIPLPFPCFCWPPSCRGNYSHLYIHDSLYHIVLYFVFPVVFSLKNVSSVHFAWCWNCPAVAVSNCLFIFLK